MNADSPTQPSDASAAPTVYGKRLGFVRGIAPSKWASRFLAATGTPLELVPVNAAFAPRRVSDAYDMLLERTGPNEMPPGSGKGGSRRALRLYRESVGLVVDIDHELASAGEVGIDELSLVHLLDHPDHAAEWPRPVPWQDPEWMPGNATAALDLVATGAGAILLPLPLARHLSNKKQHALLKVVGEPILAPTVVWATWPISHDTPDMQQLAGILRGRTARSTREGSQPAAAEARPTKVAQPRPTKKQPQLKANSRGAQLAAKQARLEREKAAKRAAKKGKRR